MGKNIENPTIGLELLGIVNRAFDVLRNAAGLDADDDRQMELMIRQNRCFDCIETGDHSMNDASSDVHLMV